MNDFKILEAMQVLSKGMEWEKWRKEIPYINFPENFLVQIVPPSTGAMVRFIIKDKEYPEDTWISIYLDCYDNLGCYGSPYWELYPCKYEDYEDTYRCGMNEVDLLISKLSQQLKVQIKASIDKKVEVNKSKFFGFNQNNSGGSFDVDENVCEYVIIEAKSVEQANNRAEEIGIYFDGCSKGLDCSCCGDRWNEAYDEEDGKEEPMIYNTPVKEAKSSCFRDGCIIHYLDGRKEIVKFNS